jgi:hypothetical protein
MGSNNSEFSLVPPHRAGMTYDEYMATKPPYFQQVSSGAGLVAAEAAAPEVILPTAPEAPTAS